VNMSNDPEQEYFSDGMTEELISALAKLEGLKVISRTSAFHFKGKDTNLRTIGESLKVEHVLEGSVRKAGNKLRITAQLIAVADDSHLWTESYNREMEDVFAIQEEISNAIVDNLKIRILRKEPIVKPYTESVVAYEAFIKGRHYYNGFTGAEGMEKALQHYERALTFDPNYAPAYSAIAEWYWARPFMGGRLASREDVYPKAKEAITRALEIDPDLPEAHATLGLIRWVLEWNFKGAEEAFKTALRLNPGSSKSHFDYAYYLASRAGKSDNAVLTARKAIELDPLSGNAYHALGASLISSDRIEEAIEKLRYAQEISPKHLPSIRWLGWAYREAGMLEEAMVEIEKGLCLFPGEQWLQSDMGHVYALRGEKEKTRGILNRLLEESEMKSVPTFAIASLFADLGEIDQVFEYLERGYERREGIGFPIIRLMPLSRLLSADPRFIAFLKKTGLDA